MKTITITSKGQITLPVQARKALCLEEGDNLIVDYNQQTRSLSLRKPASIDELSNKLSSYIKPSAKPVEDVGAYYQNHRKGNN